MFDLPAGQAVVKCISSEKKKHNGHHQQQHNVRDGRDELRRRSLPVQLSGKNYLFDKVSRWAATVPVRPKVLYQNMPRAD